MQLKLIEKAILAPELAHITNQTHRHQPSHIICTFFSPIASRSHRFSLHVFQAWPAPHALFLSVQFLSTIELCNCLPGDVKVGGGEDDDDDGEDLVARIREEANILVDRVLEESVEIIESHGQQANGHEIVKLDYNSESENYAITCDDIGGVDVIKSPTIESMSGKSFDDNMSFTDEHIHLPLHAQNTTVTATTTTTVTTQFQQQQSQAISQAIPQTAATSSSAAKGNIPPYHRVKL